LGKKYIMSAQPNYNLCTDPDDSIQLTDGIYTGGHFWTQKTTVVGLKENRGNRCVYKNRLRKD